MAAYTSAALNSGGTVEELKVTTQHGVLKAPEVKQPNQPEQAGHVKECVKKKKFLSFSCRKGKACRRFFNTVLVKM